MSKEFKTMKDILSHVRSMGIDKLNFDFGDEVHVIDVKESIEKKKVVSSKKEE